MYQARYPNFHIRAYVDQEDKKLLVRQSADQTENNAYLYMETLREFIEKFRKDPNCACAVLNQCTQDIILAQNRSREKFLQNMSEYFFENLWQDDRRQFTQQNYLFRVYQQLRSGLMFQKREQLFIVTKHLLIGLYNKLVSKNYIRNLVCNLRLNREQDTMQQAIAIVS